MCSAWDAFGCGKMIFPCAARHVSHLTSLDITWPCSKHGRVVAHAPKLSKCCECHPPDEIQIQIISDPKMLGFALTRVMVKAPWPTSWLTFLKLYVYDVYMDCSIWSLQYLCPDFQIVSEWQCIQDNYTRLTRRLLDGGCMIKLCLGGHPPQKTVDGWRHRL